jgi:predicted nucleic acid-binding protein
MNYLLDTNHASWLMAQRDTIVTRMRQAQAAGDRFGISVTVLGELYYAVYASQHHTENLRRLQALVGALLLWPFDALTAQEFGRIQAEQKVKGRPIPPGRQPVGHQHPLYHGPGASMPMSSLARQVGWALVCEPTQSTMQTWAEPKGCRLLTSPVEIRSWQLPGGHVAFDRAFGPSSGRGQATCLLTAWQPGGWLC